MNGIETVESLKNSVHSLKKKEKNGFELNAKKKKKKRFLTVIEKCKDKAKEIFKHSNIKISTKRHWHVGSVIENK